MDILSTKSSYVLNSSPDNNYGNSTDLHVCGQSTQIHRSYIEFGISNIPSTINKAILYLYCHTFGVSGTRTLNAKRITSSWVESTITWNTGQPTVTTTNMAQTSITNTEIPTWKSWDVTNMLNDETGSTFGIQVTDNDETASSTYDWYFYSDDASSLIPYLLINPYYVKVGGNDASNGLSWATAWATINKAATTVADGSTVHIGFGDYTAEPASNKIAPQNVGTLGIEYLPETATTGGGTGTVSVEQNA